MRLLVLSEGARDIGRPDGAHEGAVRVLSRRVLEAREQRELADHEIVADRLPRPHKSEKGPGARLRLALAAMSARDCESVAIVTDADNYEGRLTAWTNERDRVERERGEVPVAIGVAVQTVEAWLLADETAINGALTPDPLCATIAAPEDLWAKARTPGHPKAILEALMKSARTPVDAPYDAITSRARLDQVEKRCPSFARYAGELRGRAR
jgi:hypothetical protein